jgi:hypothetical protein
MPNERTSTQAPDETITAAPKPPLSAPPAFPSPYGRHNSPAASGGPSSQSAQSLLGNIAGMRSCTPATCSHASVITIE